ncbi:hypothetical protein CEK25_012179 [Fusarium fujikuroi]|nr:hypothetical protein CEK25_012179 [Fusarium fujikuroi]
MKHWTLAGKPFQSDIMKRKVRDPSKSKTMVGQIVEATDGGRQYLNHYSQAPDGPVPSKARTMVTCLKMG